VIGGLAILQANSKQEAIELIKQFLPVRVTVSASFAAIRVPPRTRRNPGRLLASTRPALLSGRVQSIRALPIRSEARALDLCA